MIEIKYEGDGINKLNKIEAKIMMFTIIPQDFNIENVLDHQYLIKSYGNFDIEGQFNVDANTIATTHISNPINYHLISIMFVVYIEKQCTHHKIDARRKASTHKNKIRIFMKND